MTQIFRQPLCLSSVQYIELNFKCSVLTEEIFKLVIVGLFLFYGSVGIWLLCAQNSIPIITCWKCFSGQSAGSCGFYDEFSSQ